MFPATRPTSLHEKLVTPHSLEKCRTGAIAWIACAVMAAAGAAADERAVIGSPQVFDTQDKLVGLYGGLLPVTNTRGETVNAIAVITRTGYVLPMTPQGEIGQFRSTYFSDEGCNGDEFLSPAADSRGSAPLAGLIYRSPATTEIRYVPQFSTAVATGVKSRMYFDEQNILKCEAMDSVIRALPSDVNDPAITGFKREQAKQRAIALRIPEDTRNQARGLSQLTQRKAANPTLQPQLNFPEEQECSPGCLLEDVGNNVCDISCYVEACYFDSSDCSNESAEYLEKELALMCSPGCFLDDLEDSFCDQACNNSACEFDRGDCN